MKKILVKKWKVDAAVKKVIDGKLMAVTEKQEQSTITAVINILDRVWEKIPNGIENFRTYKRIAKSFEVAEKSGEILLEEGDYSKVCKLVEENIPAILGLQKEYSDAIEGFLSPEPEAKPEVKKK